MVTYQQIYTGIAIAIVVGEAAVGFLAYLDYIGPHIPILIGGRGVLVSDVQFEEGYLNVTITNYDSQEHMVKRVILSHHHPDKTILADEIVYKPIPGNEKISICINLNWTSRYEYELRIVTTAGYSGTWSPRAP